MGWGIGGGRAGLRQKRSLIIFSWVTSVIVSDDMIYK